MQLNKFLPLFFYFYVGTGLIIGFATPSKAMDSDVKTVLKCGSYGMAVGATTGLLLLPLSGGNLRTPFLGTSIGLYLGLAIGFYHITHRDDPQNPLSRASPQAESQMLWTRSDISLFEFSAEIMKF